MYWGGDVWRIKGEIAGRTPQEGTFSRLMFRFRKAGSSKLSASGMLAGGGPALIRHPWLRSAFWGHPCPQILDSDRKLRTSAFLHSHISREKVLSCGWHRLNLRFRIFELR